MERVQYSLEASLPELKDLQANGIFSPAEIKEIIKRRTNYELQLVRRQPRKKDFLEYIEYEMALERLRRKRVARLDTPLPHSLSSHSLIQKQFSIFERATRKFKGDVRLWVQYIDVAKREGAGNLVGRVAAKALKLHPASIPLYILAAQHELDQSSPSAARNLLQRGIRLNTESIDLWCEYVKMELGWCEFLKRRWETLGIQPTDGDTEDFLSTTQPETESARREVLNGAIVKEVLKNALDALPSLKTFGALLQTLQIYPTPLAKSSMPFLFDLLISCGNMEDANQAQIRAMYSTRHLSTVPDGKALVKGLKLANEELVDACNHLYQNGGPKSQNNADVFQENETLAAYAQFVGQQWKSVSDTNLRLYLSSSLHNICNTILQHTLSPGTAQGSGRDAIFSTHLRILLDPTHPQPVLAPKKALKLARQYSVTSKNPDVWWWRLETEQGYITAHPPSPPTPPSEALSEVSRLARTCCTGEGVENIWTWGWENLTIAQREALVKQSFALPLESRTVQLREILLLRMLSSLYQTASIVSSDRPDAAQETTAKGRHQIVMRLLQNYFPSPVVYKHAFELERALPNPNSPKSPQPGQSSSVILENIYLLWRDGSISSKEDATFAYAACLLGSGLVGEATRLMNDLVTTASSSDTRERMERRWKAIIEGDPLENEQVRTRMEVDDAMDAEEGTSGTGEDSSSDVEFIVVG